MATKENDGKHRADSATDRGPLVVTLLQRAEWF